MSTTMTRSDVSALLALIVHYDNRTFDAATVTEWHGQANLGNWELDTAMMAVRRFFATELESTKPRPWLTPGHITHLIKTSRAGSPSAAPWAEVKAKMLTEAPPASEETRRAALEAVRATFASGERTPYSVRQRKLTPLEGERDVLRDRPQPTALGALLGSVIRPPTRIPQGGAESPSVCDGDGSNGVAV
jgi:hypothetical protein